MSDRLHLVVDGVDGRTHYVETTDTARLDEVKRGHIVALGPVPATTEPRAADLNIRHRLPGHEPEAETILHHGEAPAGERGDAGKALLGV
jgi:hypothetical protein